MSNDADDLSRFLKEQRERADWFDSTTENLLREADDHLRSLTEHAVPAAFLDRIDHPEDWVKILAALPDNQLATALLHVAYHLHLPQAHKWLFEHFFLNTSFSDVVRAAAASGLGSMFEQSHAADVSNLLRTTLLDENESNQLRQACYFGLLRVNDLPPFPEDLIGNWNALFDSFQFPRDVNWQLIQNLR
jgi:hypothetical protein